MTMNKELTESTTNLYKDFCLTSSTIIEGQSLLISKFSNFYSSCGYIQAEPANVLSDQDQSVIFTGATISPLKTYLLDGTIPNPGLFIVQPCLRTQKKDYFYDDSRISEYNSYFQQVGVLAPADRYEDVCEESLRFLNVTLGINMEDIVVHVPSENPELHRRLGLIKDLKIAVDEHEPEYYHWRYGLEGVTGNGITYAIRQNGTDNFRDIGNVIMIYNEHQLIAAEWGFGIETLMSRIFDLPSPQAASKIGEIVSFTSNTQEKMLDTLVAAIEMYKLGITPGSGKGNYILKTYLKGLNYLRRELDLQIDDIKRIASSYLGSDIMKDNIVNGIASYLTQQDSNIQNYKNWARDITASCLERGLDPTESLTKLRQRLGIQTNELIN